MLALVDLPVDSLVYGFLPLIVGAFVVWLYSSRLPKQTAQAVSTSSAATAPAAELPKGWWTDSSLFQLERRAIFSKTWICVSHRSRFVKAGDYVSQDIAGFRVFLILGQDGVVRTFHNVCRHRAYPVARKASGSATVLGCRYHGWSYNTKGHLTKAPHFDQVEGFVKEQNGLFEITTQADSQGFLHINMNNDVDSKEQVHTDVAGRPASISAKTCRFVHSWEAKGQFNWKVVVHDQWKKDGFESHRAAFSGTKTNGLTQVLSACGVPAAMGQLQFFPLATVHTMAGSPFWYQISYSPDSARQTTVRCDVYTTQKPGSWSFEGPAQEQLEKHMQSLVKSYESTYAQLTNLKWKASPAEDHYNYTQLAGLVQEHRKTERLEGREINPAAVQQCRSSAFAQAESICQAISCGTNSKLDW